MHLDLFFQIDLVFRNGGLISGDQFHDFEKYCKIKKIITSFYAKLLYFILNKYLKDTSKFRISNKNRKKWKKRKKSFSQSRNFQEKKTKIEIFEKTG